MLKKKTSKDKKTDKLVELDSAVSELSKQTEALLSSFGSEHKQEEASRDKKPTLPKKQAVSHAKIKHFDIIHDPKTKKKLQSTLKTAPKQDQIDKDELLIPASTLTGHDQEQKHKTVAEASSGAAVVVQAHKEGLLAHESIDDPKNNNLAQKDDVHSDATPVTANAAKAISFVEPGGETATVDKADSSLDQRDASELGNKPEEVTTASDSPKEDTAQKSDETVVKTAPDSITDPEAPKHALESSVAQSDTEDKATAQDKERSSQATATDPADDIKEEQTSYRGELYANNLIKEAQPKGFEAQADGKPMLYDTEEYHPELHDWSTLQHNSGASWLVLLLVLVIAGAIAYFALTGQSLPFEINL